MDFKKMDEFIRTIPKWDDKLLMPEKKMPCCPSCSEDELRMLGPRRVICNYCSFDLWIN